MKSPLLACLTLLVLAVPASAEPRRHHHRHHHGHIVGTHARRGEAGFPITAAKDSIRINAVGEVISQPVAAIEKERKFDARAKRELSTRPATAAPSQQPMSAPQQQP